jgi:formamidopyrimidine-DNA glycosylase
MRLKTSWLIPNTKNRPVNMPELPEVETIKRQLSRKIKGKTIKRVEIRLLKLVKMPAKKFKKRVEGQKILDVQRRAKLVIFRLSDGYLLTHLKMTGQLIFNGEENKHTYLIYHFTAGSYLLHNDLRKFGFVKLVGDLEKYFIKEKYGPEPLENDFTLKVFKELLKGKKTKIKPLLMNQQFIVGVGNLYADEILFSAGVLPTRKASDLKEKEIKKIYQGIKRILELAVKKKGSSADDYLDTAGKKGTFFPDSINVYRREGEPCFKCGTKIKRIKIGARSAHFCPKCQS